MVVFVYFVKVKFQKPPEVHWNETRLRSRCTIDKAKEDLGSLDLMSFHGLIVRPALFLFRFSMYAVLGKDIYGSKMKLEWRSWKCLC